MKLRILPFTDGGYSSKAKDKDKPRNYGYDPNGKVLPSHFALQPTKLLKINNELDPTIKTESLELATIIMLNGGTDGGKPVMTYIYDRDYGDWHGSAELESSGIEIAHSIPSFFGVKRPEDLNTDVERRHWEVIYKSREEFAKLCNDFEKMTTTEQYMYGLSSYTGVNHYLAKTHKFIKTDLAVFAETEGGNAKQLNIINLFS
jgi:hypothetical protein